MAARESSRIIKTCACGRSYTPAQWRQLPDRSIGRLPWGEVHEYRQCLCGSHIVIELSEGGVGSVGRTPRMKLYGFAPTRSLRVLWMLLELEVKFEFVNV